MTTPHIDNRVIYYSNDPPVTHAQLLKRVDNYFDEILKEFDAPEASRKPVIPLDFQPGTLYTSTQINVSENRYHFSWLSKLIDQKEVSSSFSAPAPDPTQLKIEPKEYLTQYNRVALLGEPGAGKTTALRQLFRNFSKQWQTAHLGQSNNEIKTQYKIPLYLDLGRWERTLSLRTFLKDTLTPYGLAASLDDWLENGTVLLLLDRLDQIPDLERNAQGNIDVKKDKRVFELANLEHQFSKVTCVLTCRTKDFPSNLQWNKWYDLHVLDLNPEQIQDLVATSISYKEYQDFQQEFWSAFSTNKKFARLRELMSRPFYLTHLVDYYYYKRREGYSPDKAFPANPAQLLKSGIERTLNLDERDRLSEQEIKELQIRLGCLAFNMIDAGQPGQGVKWEQAVAWMFKKPAVTKDEQKQADKLLKLAQAAGLIIKKSNQVEFYHDLFKEYFCAFYLKSQSVSIKDKLFLRISGDNFEQVWFMYAGLDDENPSLSDKLITRLNKQPISLQSILSILLWIILAISMFATGLFIPIALYEIVNKNKWVKHVKKDGKLLETLDAIFSLLFPPIAIGFLNGAAVFWIWTNFGPLPFIVSVILIILSYSLQYFLEKAMDLYKACSKVLVSMGRAENKVIQALLRGQKHDFLSKEHYIKLGRLGDEKIIFSLLKSVDPYSFGNFSTGTDREVLINTLKEMGEEAVDIVIKAVVFPEWKIKDGEEKAKNDLNLIQPATWALGQLGMAEELDDEGAKRIADALADALCQSYYFWHEEELRNARFFKALLAALGYDQISKKKEIGYRRIGREAIASLKTMGERASAAKNDLIKALSDKDANVRSMAAQALGEMGASEALFKLEQVAHRDISKNKWGQSVSLIAEEAIKKINSA